MYVILYLHSSVRTMRMYSGFIEKGELKIVNTMSFELLLDLKFNSFMGKSKFEAWTSR